MNRHGDGIGLVFTISGMQRQSFGCILLSSTGHLQFVKIGTAKVLNGAGFVKCECLRIEAKARGIKNHINNESN